MEISLSLLFLLVLCTGIAVGTLLVVILAIYMMSEEL